MANWTQGEANQQEAQEQRFVRGLDCCSSVLIALCLPMALIVAIVYRWIAGF